MAGFRARNSAEQETPNRKDRGDSEGQLHGEFQNGKCDERMRISARRFAFPRPTRPGPASDLDAIDPNLL